MLWRYCSTTTRAVRCPARTDRHKRRDPAGPNGGPESGTRHEGPTGRRRKRTSLATPFDFQVTRRDAHTRARSGVLHTPHGPVATPVFMPVGTQGTVKGLTPEQLADAGARVLLANAYHLALRPGEEAVARLGGLHRFINWNGPILTDSGGFQLYSLARLCRIEDEGVTFRSHVDGTLLTMTPERAIAIQEALGADIIMALDQCPAYSASAETVREATERTVRWADRCIEAHHRRDQMLMGIVQGGADPDLRQWCAEQLTTREFGGFAMGGLSVGEPHEEMLAVLDRMDGQLPPDRPRYVMGIGRPIDLLDAVSRGADMFDCVLPTRNGRNASAFTSCGRIRVRNQQYAADDRPLDPSCGCACCRGFSRAYVRHLFVVGEMLGPILVSLHNIHYFCQVMQEIRCAIEKGTFSRYYETIRPVLAGA